MERQGAPAKRLIPRACRFFLYRRYALDADTSQWHGNERFSSRVSAGLYFLDESGVICYKKIAG